MQYGQCKYIFGTQVSNFCGHLGKVVAEAEICSGICDFIPQGAVLMFNPLFLIQQKKLNFFKAQRVLSSSDINSH